MSIVSSFKEFIGYPEDDDLDEIDEEVIPEQEDEHRGRVLNISAATQLQVVLVTPGRFEDVADIADHVIAKRAVMLNLESAGREASRRLLDFLSGVAYSKNGQIKRVATGTYLITPYNVDIMDDLLDALEDIF